MFEDRSGAFWIASHHIFRLPKGPPVRLDYPRQPVPELIGLKETNSITGDQEGNLWLFDLKRGLFEFSNGHAAKIGDLGLASGQGWLYADRDDRIWLGEYGRVIRYDHGKLQEFGARDGVPAGQIFAICQDHRGNVWAFGEGGISRYENARFRTLSTTNGLPARTFGGTEDNDGSWWIAADDGVVRIANAELNRALREPAYPAHFEVFNMIDNLPGHPGQRVPMPIVARTRDGRIWFATSNGLAFVNPRHIPYNPLPPPVHVEEIRIDGRPKPVTNGMSLPHDMNELEIDYSALSLSIPERVRFRYKLEGAETIWHEAGTRRQAYYNHLDPKQYRFRVIACNNDGVWNQAGDTFIFSRAPAFYEAKWFRLLESLTGIALIWFFYRLRLRQMTAGIALRYTERLAERTRIARDLHDTLLQDLAGVSLQLDGISKHARSPDSVISLTSRLRQQVDACFEEARSRVWNLRTPALEGQGLPMALGELVERMRGTTSSRCDLTVLGTPHSFPVEVEEQLLLIAQEAVNNSIRHAEPSAINLMLKYTRRSLRLQIRDDGRGFDVEASSRKPGHWGLTNLRERAAKIHAKFHIASAVGQGSQVDVFVRRPVVLFRRIRVLDSD
jgi:signal transduction histidine kinase